MLSGGDCGEARGDEKDERDQLPKSARGEHEEDKCCPDVEGRKGVGYSREADRAWRDGRRVQPLPAERIDGAAGWDDGVEHGTGNQLRNVSQDDAGNAAIARQEKPGNHHGNHHLVDKPERDAQRALEMARDAGGGNAESRVNAEEDVVEFPGEGGALAAHEDVEEHAVKEIEDESKDELGARSVFLVAEHPDDGEEEGHDAEEGRIEENVDDVHRRLQRRRYPRDGAAATEIAPGSRAVARAKTYQSSHAGAVQR